MERKLAFPFMHCAFHKLLQLRSGGNIYLFICLFLFIIFYPAFLTPPVMWRPAPAHDRLSRRPFLCDFCLRLSESDGGKTHNSSWKCCCCYHYCYYYCCSLSCCEYGAVMCLNLQPSSAVSDVSSPAKNKNKKNKKRSRHSKQHMVLIASLWCLALTRLVWMIIIITMIWRFSCAAVFTAVLDHFCCRRPNRFRVFPVPLLLTQQKKKKKGKKNLILICRNDSR